MFPSTSDTAEMPVGSITFTSSTPGLGVCFADVVAESVGRAMFGRTPVRKDALGVVSHFPSGHWIRARMWYVVAAFIPGTRIETGPPPAGAGTGEVGRPYCVVGPNSTVTVVSAGSVIAQRATSGWVVGWTEAERSACWGSDAMAGPPRNMETRLVKPAGNHVPGGPTDKRFVQENPRRRSECGRLLIPRAGRPRTPRPIQQFLVNSPLELAEGEADRRLELTEPFRHPHLHSIESLVRRNESFGDCADLRSEAFRHDVEMALERPDLRSETLRDDVEISLERPEFRSERPEFRSERPDLRSETLRDDVEISLERPEFRSERPDLRSETLSDDVEIALERPDL